MTESAPLTFPSLSRWEGEGPAAEHSGSAAPFLYFVSDGVLEPTAEVPGVPTGSIRCS